MGLPEEDRGPAWLRDWGSSTGYTETNNFTGYVDGDALAVDIQDLIAFSDALKKEHEEDYRPHVREVYDYMGANPAQPDERFVELHEIMRHHRDMLVQASTALANHDKAVASLVTASRNISEAYQGADAMSAARVSDVESNLGAPPPSVTDPTVTPETVTPEEAASQTPEEPPSETGNAPDDGEEY